MSQAKKASQGIVWDAQEIYRKLKLSGELFEFALELKSTQIKRKYPKLSDQECRRKALSLFR